jgi:ankyrin repeat protein
MINVLLDYGANCDKRDNKGYSALNYAIHYDRLDSFKILLAYGCNSSDLEIPEEKNYFRDEMNKINHSVFYYAKNVTLEN